jgi:hypothetical protein
MMWTVIGAAAFALSGASQEPGPDFDNLVRNLPQREVAQEQERTASGQCGSSMIGVGWSVVEDAPALRSVIDGQQTDVTADAPEIAAFLAAGGAQRAYLVCLPDGTFEATFFRGLATGEEGPIDYAARKFVFSVDGRIVRVLPTREIDEDLVRVWHRGR